MALRVLHILETLELTPGAVAVSLNGAIAPLSALGIDGRLVGGHVEHATLEGVSLVHVHGWGYPAASAAIDAAAQRKLPVVISPHGLVASPSDQRGWFARLRQRRQEKRLLRAASMVTGLNDHEEQLLRNLHSNVRVLPYGLRFDDYSELPVSTTEGSGSWIVMLDSMHPRGGCVALLKALAEIGPDSAGWKCALVGGEGGQWRPMLEAAVRRKGGADRVRFETAASLGVQREWLLRATLVAAPGLQVTFPLSIMQGLAAGVPVLASTLTAPPGADGMLRVCGPTRVELRKALRVTLAESDEARRRSARAASERARAVLDWSALAPRWAEMYRELV